MSAANHSRINEAIEETYLGPSKFKQGIRFLKWMALSMFFGAGGGAYEMYNYDHNISDPVIAEIAAGWCGQKDKLGTFFLYACKDSFIAMQLQQDDMKADAKLANRSGDDTDTILADMAKKKPAKRKPVP